MSHVAGQIIECDAESFQRDLNLLPYEIGHNLASHPLFQLPALVELAQRVAARRNPHMSGGDAYFNEGAIEAGAKPNYDRPEEQRAAVVDLVRKIEQAEAWIILKHIEREDGYREVMEAAVCDALKIAGDAGKELFKKIKWFEAIVFITSPHRVTEYHIDRECSWIFQIRGNKAIHLFDRADKEIVPEDELERFYTVDNRASTYKPQFEDRAIVFEMTPGTGVHIPVNTPHWLKNGDDVSITLNVNFQFHDSEISNLYKANYYLRRAGMTPSIPGQHKLADRAKALAFTGALALKRTLKPGDGVVPPEAKAQKRRIAELVGAR
ncbi:hypothetical protein SAMN05421770_102318 [Granulicella rosea]|uniref:JmjC domain-containing protein n=1 Tax=Granulicella rosea TaxID=474952 RepID=A0A239HCH8_9BACT|nr:hypothetical protein [Granulicella rosea]SNS78503.1 hypothetical protein SAMN05421770_102318 [Granulicella rosea]